jgi:hypothetical protein
MEPQEERITYYRQSLFEGSPDPSTVDESHEAFELARQGRGPWTPQELEPLPFHPSETVQVVVEYRIESGKASETFPPSWAHEHGRFDEPPDVERVVLINREQKRFGI